MYKSRYFSDPELARVLADTDLELDRRAEEERFTQIQAWITDPKNAAIINNDPMVKQLRAMSHTGATPAPSRAAAPAAPVQRIGFSNEAKDPHVTSPSAKSKPAESVRYAPGAPALPPGGFWVL